MEPLCLFSGLSNKKYRQDAQATAATARSNRPSSQKRQSIVTFCPSMAMVSLRPLRNAAVAHAPAVIVIWSADRWP